mmetsp:Transcript_31725/g.68188  ORF Transcript_31725/g.68188 Transcript_31725/m.68188 type:complete len:87 (+) Transcript_31725:51-311(+)|eukprot:CAMPEP_0183364358 /NCGR_PEP_ID=MMETSP0164_2-20130417/79725_1 /TAXON_ID=221442 /ORGANISM="Coccolithus pelagicus ssp braarudi, Strain PLY182g" /LENGTH=86 /DNA_ID=CAMNT_0025539633 /DNA_START=42 /DNA_END=302 /DNA_ORIENTATION=-
MKRRISKSTPMYAGCASGGNACDSLSVSHKLSAYRRLARAIQGHSHPHALNVPEDIVKEQGAWVKEVRFHSRNSKEALESVCDGWD